MSIFNYITGFRVMTVWQIYNHWHTRFNTDRTSYHIWHYVRQSFKISPNVYYITTPPPPPPPPTHTHTHTHTHTNTQTIRWVCFEQKRFRMSDTELIIIVTSLWARWRLKSPASRLFTQAIIQAQIKENIKAPRHWPLWGEFTGDRWIPRTKDQ